MTDGVTYITDANKSLEVAWEKLAIRLRKRTMEGDEVNFREARATLMFITKHGEDLVNKFLLNKLNQ